MICWMSLRSHVTMAMVESPTSVILSPTLVTNMVTLYGNKHGYIVWQQTWLHCMWYCYIEETFTYNIGLYITEINGDQSHLNNLLYCFQTCVFLYDWHQRLQPFICNTIPTNPKHNIIKQIFNQCDSKALETL